MFARSLWTETVDGCGSSVEKILIFGQYLFVGTGSGQVHVFQRDVCLSQSYKRAPRFLAFMVSVCMF